jgi:hypothetical protein
MAVKLNRNLSKSATAKLAPEEYLKLCAKADVLGMTLSEHVRRLILADLEVANESNLLQTVEAEHTRVVILAAQQGQQLTPQLLKSLRAEAIVRAPALVENTLRLLKQRSLPDAV